MTFDNQGETIVLGGTVRSAAVAEDARKLAVQQVNGNPAKVISTIKVDAPNQVQLRVKVAEVKRDSLKRMGIDWRSINNITLFGTSMIAGAAVRTISVGSSATSSGALSLVAPGSFNSLIDFLATQNQATILAEPNLIAMSGETASFLAGGEIPDDRAAGRYDQCHDHGDPYKQVGVSLAFTPTIIGDRINLKVAPEVSQLSTVGSISVPLTATAVVTVPGIQTRKASTTIELGSGQSFAIAGLLQASFAAGHRQVAVARRHSGPGLAVQVRRLPALGRPSSSSSSRRTSSNRPAPSCDTAYRSRAADRRRSSRHAALQPSDAAAARRRRPRASTVGPTAGFKLD